MLPTVERMGELLGGEVLDDSRAMFDAGDAARVRWVNPQTGLTTEDLEHIGAFFSGARHVGCTHTDNSFCM